MKNFDEDFDELIRNKKIFEVKYEKHSPLMLDLESKVKRLVFYSEYEIQKNVISSFFILLLVLYVIRPFLFSFKSMIKEVKNK
jgi:negative regulator of replication initiation